MNFPLITFSKRLTAFLTPNKRIPSGELCAGSPAKFMRELTDDDYTMVAWSAKHYVQLGKNYKES